MGDLVRIPLPEWVLAAGRSDPDIFFTDRPRAGAGIGQRNREYLSFWADEEPVLQGRTPVQVRGCWVCWGWGVFCIWGEGLDHHTHQPNFNTTKPKPPNTKP